MFSKKIAELGFEKLKVKETEGDTRSYDGYVGLKPPKEYLDPYLKNIQKTAVNYIID
jgi:hypothetical protein